jgi:hypothetical protein
MNAAPNEPRAAPGTRTARHDQHPAKDTDPRSRATVAPGEALRRRRAAADRLPPLAGSVRDPLDGLAGELVREVAYDLYDVTDLGLGCAHGDECGRYPLAAP